ncbi:hypothetical protein D0X99_05185 [Algoriphagus lacus]|uniref:Methylmalonyl-CoA mutase alpha/beta chain catalytic domain-containing protein n=1 Tax=Algoriphagus lacus TaxID=2056311 RepID=A0A418PU28_9BACT|nr:methylmalonyl-CoA mutase family protein [Algoriphagus lacus]RIW17148.1 hypothetical protein D0X99_05185 [Algoriphagus lacus]
MTRDLFSEFSPSSKQAWLDQVARELKGKDLSSTLQSKLWDRIELEAFYTSEDIDSKQLENQLKFHRDSEIPGMPPRIWSNLITVFPDDTNDFVINALSNGAEGLVLHIYGMEDLEELLKGVLPQYISILVKPLGNPVMALKSFFEWVDSTGTSPDLITGGLLWTPSDLVFDHNESYGIALDTLKELFEMAEPYPNFKAFSINTSRYSESGGNPLDAVVFGLGELIEIIDGIGLEPAQIFHKIMIEASVGDAHFGEIARLKSLRILVSELAGLYGLEVQTEDLVLLSSTSSWSKSILDAHTNLIRQTYEAMASVLGGANLIWVKPIQEDSASSRDRRIARNVSSILKEEAYLDKVKDPAAGSYFLGKLIEKTTETFKSGLQQLESQGGWQVALESGEIHRQVRVHRQTIQNDVADSRISKIGVNKYPASEKLKYNLEFEVFEEKSFELKPSRAVYLFELHTLNQP